MEFSKFIINLHSLISEEKNPVKNMNFTNSYLIKGYNLLWRHPPKVEHGFEITISVPEPITTLKGNVWRTNH